MIFTKLFGTTRAQFVLLACLSASLLFGNLHRGDLSGYDDAVYAHEGKQMLLSGDWWTVRLNGRLDFDKPPLFVWLEALSFSIFGLSDWAAKFPAALLGFGVLLLVYTIARDLSGSAWVANLALFVLASTQYFLKYAMHAMTDVPFTFFFALAIWCYLKAWSQRPQWWLGCGAAIACCILTRSILGLLVVGVIGLHLLWLRRAQVLSTLQFWLGCCLALGVPLLWYVAQYQLYGPEFLVRHFAFTVENARSIQPAGNASWLLGLAQYPWLLLKLYWPWWPCLLFGLAWAVKQTWRKAALAPSLLLLWVLCVVVPFSLIESKVLRYLLPAFPAFSILVAYTLDQWIPAARRQTALVGASALLGLLFLGTALFPGHRLRARDVKQLLPPIEAVIAPTQQVLFYAGGAPRWDYVHQLIWYSAHRFDLAAGFPELLAHLNHATLPPVIVDQATFQQFFASQQVKVELLAYSEHFLCFRRKSNAAALTAAPEPVLVARQ
jgi:4-amino-4-deoxy-L-arabinose transferase-like glycosyltransferase